MKSFVLVCLNDVNKYIIVRENFIFDLNQQKVKNYGVNRNQDYKIFWSHDKSCETPNFQANQSKIFPPLTPEACYSGRLYKFFCKYFQIILMNKCYCESFDIVNVHASYSSFLTPWQEW